MKTLVVAPKEAQKSLLALYRKNDLFSDVKFVTKSEVLNNKFYFYNDDAVKFLISKYGFDYDLACRYLKAIKYLTYPYNETVKAYKNLFDIRDSLLEAGLLTKNDLYDEELKRSDIHVYYYSNKDPELAKAFEGFKVTYHEESEAAPKTFNEFEFSDDQLFFVFNKIEELLDNGVNPSNIFLYGLMPDDEVIVRRLVSNFKVNINGAFKRNIISLSWVRNLIESFNGNLEDTLESIQEDLPHKDEVIELLKEFNIADLSLDKQKQLYVDVFNVRTLKQDRFQEAITVLNEPIVSENDYLFIVNYAQGIYPSVHSDDDFLDDSEKRILGIPTSEDLNEMDNLFYKNVLQQKCKGMYLSYSQKNFSQKMMPASYAKEFKQKTVKAEIQKKIYSKDEALLQFGNYKDKARKYLYKPDILYSYIDLFKDKDVKYRDYYPQFNAPIRFRGFDSEIKFSYSQAKSFFECRYKYYLNKVLKLDEFESNFNTSFGNVAHYLLQHLDQTKTFEEQYQVAYQRYEHEFLEEEKIFLIKLKNDLEVAYNFIVEHENQVENGRFVREKDFDIQMGPNAYLTGKIDKVIFSGPNQEYVTIIDYKSGDESFIENDVQYGYSLQLPTYAYIFEKHPYFKDKKLIAMAISPLLNKEGSKGYLGDVEKYKAGLRLNGVYLNDVEALKTMDSTIDSGTQYLKSANIKKDGTFEAKAKLRSEEQLNEYANQAKTLLNEATQEILDNRFEINPAIKSGKSACDYCPFRDICYRNLKMFRILNNKEGEEE